MDFRNGLVGLALAATALTGACVYLPQETMKPEAKDVLRGKTFSVATHDHLDTRVQTMGMTGMFGGLAGPYFASEGERVTRENNIADPAVASTGLISEALEKNYGMHMVGERNRLYTGPGHDTFLKVDAPDLLAFYTDGDYLLDVDSNMWWMMYNMVDGYHVLYQG